MASQKNTITALTDKAKDQADVIQKKVKKEWNEVADDFQQMEKKAADYVKKNPAKAAAVMAGVGIAIGAAVATVITKKGSKHTGSKKTKATKAKKKK